MKKIILFLVILVVLTTSTFSQVVLQASPSGFMSQREFHYEWGPNRNRNHAGQGMVNINSNMVPNAVHQVLWRELNRYNLRNGDVFDILIRDRNTLFAFTIQITNNGQNWSGWIWRRMF